MTEPTAANDDQWVKHVCTHCERVFDASHDSDAAGRPCGYCREGKMVKLRDLQIAARQVEYLRETHARLDAALGNRTLVGNPTLDDEVRALVGSTKVLRVRARRLRLVLESIEKRLAFMPTRWPMWCRVATDAETLTVELLGTLAIGLGKEPVDWRTWCYENYPEVPGPVRCVATAIRMRMEAAGTYTDDAYRVAFGEELARMVADWRARLEAAPETA